MSEWIDDINKLTVENDNFRTVVFTGEHTQLTLMRLAPGEEIGWEAHGDLDQFVRLEQGDALVEFGRTEDQVDARHEVSDDWAFIVPAGVWHNVVNVGDEDVKLYSLYSPPEHPDDTVHPTKAEADSDEH
jgi:mannose-6-phosphate isomerase-like protein (cupin superfamily)